MAKPKPKSKRKRRIVGSRQYANYSDEMLQLAAENVRSGEMSSYAAEKMFNIPRRTILNKAKNKHNKPPGGQLILTEGEEKQFVGVLIAAADFGSPLTELDLRIVVHEHLKKNNKEYLFKDKMPGRWWVKNFLERYKTDLTTRVTQNIKKVRAEKTESELEEYFENLKISLKDVPNTNILNFDETNFSDNPGNIKCIFKRSVKYPERIMNFTKGSISVMFAATANGDCLPPYTVYKGENMWNLWRLNGPRGSRYNRTKSGWFDSVTFEDWFQTVILPWAKDLQGTKVIIGDNLSSHVNVNIFKMCQEHDIRFVFLPPNATHLAQPLDVSFFGPLKKQWRKILTQYKIDYPNNSALNKADFPGLLKTLMENLQVSKKENIVSGFRTTGIAPFNPAKVLRKLPTYEETVKYNVDETLLSYLKAQRTPKATENKRRNKKIAIPPGKSVEAQDIEEIIQQNNLKTNKNRRKYNKGKKNDKSKDIVSIIDCEVDNPNMPSTSISQNETEENARQMSVTIDNLNMPSTSTSQNETKKNARQITVIQEEIVERGKLSEILQDIDLKTLKRRQAICSRVFMEDSDTDVTDIVSLHESEDSPMEDYDNSDEEKENEIKETMQDYRNSQGEKEMDIEETYFEITIPDYTKEEKDEKTENAEKDENTDHNKENDATYLERNKTDNTMDIEETYFAIKIPDNTKEEKTENAEKYEKTDTDKEKDATYLEKKKTDNTKKEKKMDEMCREKIRIGSFLLVRFVTKKSTKYYIGEVMVIQDVGMTVKFLRKKTINNVFVWPIKEDVGFVLKSDIETILPSPELLRRGMYKFKFKFDKYNVC